MSIPWIALAVVNLHHAHALLGQAHRHQATERRAARPVHVESGLALLADVEYFGASVCMRKAVSMVLMEASSCESCSPSFARFISFSLRRKLRSRRWTGSIDVGVGNVRDHFGGFERLALRPTRS